MSCTDCQAAKETEGGWRQYDSLSCEHCTARLIQQLGRLNMPQSETPTSWREKVTARRKQVLADSVAAGLDEQEIRKLAKGPLALSTRGRRAEG